MNSTFRIHERPEFTPPPQPGLLRSVGLAILAHVVLVLALSWGLQWKHDTDQAAVEAELWSPTVQRAAPKPVEAAPPPPAPQPRAVQPEPPARREADIALERERQRQEREKAEREKAERERQERERAAAEKRRLEEERKQEQAKKAAEERKRQELARAKAKAEEEARVEKLRQEQLARIAGMAGATGGPSATGTVLASSGPSSSYAGLVVARVRPNIVFTDPVAGNPRAEVEVRIAPDGTIVGKRILKSSGVKAWDEAVLRALDRTETLPRDGGRPPPASMVIGFRPRD